MMTGGIFWALNISNVEDMRRRFGTRFVVNGTRVDTDAEKEAEKWVSSILDMIGKKEEKDTKEEDKK